MPPIISVSGLSKTYASGFRALKNVDLEIRRGEIFALLGPNGAGKTTTLKMLSGLLYPSGGELSVLADAFAITAKSLRPLPDKHAGLTDAQSRVRMRYVDLIVNPSNCVQCGAITAKGGRLTPPEGGDGPVYRVT